MLVTVTAVGLLSASVASASFHLMNIRQVFGGNGNAANDYVELQMRSTGENFTFGHPIQVYNAVGLQYRFAAAEVASRTVPTSRRS